MKKTFSILHISDLHKEKSADYKFLLSSLEADSGKWAKEGIPAPDFIVVSGDLVQGVKQYTCSKDEAYPSRTDWRRGDVHHNHHHQK